MDATMNVAKGAAGGRAEAQAWWVAARVREGAEARGKRGARWRCARPVALTWTVRFVLAGSAVAGSAVYAGSFALMEAVAWMAPIACAVGAAASAAWIGFGFLLLTTAQMRPKRYAAVGALHWADACLVTMGVGVGMKMIGVGANVLAAAWLKGDVEAAVVAPVQLALLVAADVVMAWLFFRLVTRLGMPVKQAAGLWIVALNGLFAFVLAMLAYGEVI